MLRRRRILIALPAAWLLLTLAAHAQNAIGVSGEVGCGVEPKRVERLHITRPGVYENYLVDSNGKGGNRVKISADNVTLRNCEIRNATGNGIGIFGRNVTIENCRIHRLLHSTFADQHDAHGITGGWNKVVIRNCEIFHVSGDAIQFDPDRGGAGKVLIENCTLWTGPLPADAAGFRKGERPGENGFDSKTPPRGPRCELVIRHCHFRGWNQPGQVSNMAAVNLKEHVSARIENCLFEDNEIALRLRGPTGRGDARIAVSDCVIFDAKVGLRLEDGLRELRVRNVGFGPGVARRFHFVGGRDRFPGLEIAGEREIEGNVREMLRSGVR